MLARQHRPGPIVKTARAPFAPIFLLRRLGGIATLLRDRRRATMRATDPGYQATPETAPLTTPKIDPHKYLVIGLERPQSA